jgi:flagellar biosynthesis protein FlhF
MKIRRFVAADMKTALAQIKEQLGADAVIMSNKKIAEGVEIMAAVDYYPESKAAETDEVSATSEESVARAVDNDVVSLGKAKSSLTDSPISDNVQRSNTAPADSLSALLNRKIQLDPEVTVTPKKVKQVEPVSDIELQFKNFTDRLEQTTNQRNNEQSAENHTSAPQRLNPLDTMDSSNEHQTHSAAPESTHYASTSETQSPEFENMKKEMNTIRHLLEHQLSGLMWQDMAQKNPQKALLINKLVALGLTDHMADQIAGFIPPQRNDQDAWEQAKSFISQQLNTTNNDIIHHGGVISLVGPTGVGKTTTIAKLAARFAQIHGADEVVLISTDSFRIGGFEQLTTYGRIIGCQVKLANDADALDALLQQFGQKKLVLIDTAGMGQRDMRLAHHLTDLIANARVRIRNYLVLSANTQQRVMQENVERFKKIPLAGCIYTKLDESISIGEIISTSIQNGLPIGYLTDGQRVPEDIKVANAEKLVTLADRMATKTKTEQHNSAWRPMPNKAASTA